MTMNSQQQSARIPHGYHLPVMADEVIAHLITDPDGIYVDATLGGGGHALRILDALSAKGSLIGLDRDKEAVDRNKIQFTNEPRMAVHQAEFSRLGEFCEPQSLSGTLFDLGVSSRQLDSKARGFSFSAGTELDMRMGDVGPDAVEMLRQWDEWELSSVLRRNADIDQAKKLARNILNQIAAGTELNSDLIRKAVEMLPGVHGDNRNSLLARVFQAIRMEVNDEMGQVERGLHAAVKSLRVGGRICVLSYHSVEDRKVKETFAEYERDCICAPNLPVCMCGSNNRRLKKVVRRPLLPTKNECAQNPRARSAKLRVVEKV